MLSPLVRHHRLHNLPLVGPLVGPLADAALGYGRELQRRDARLARATNSLLLLLPVLIVLSLVDARMVTGANAWVKPIKFALSFAAYFATVGWLLGHLTHFPRARRLISRGNVLGGVMEAPALLIQAARGVRSHYNSETLFDSVLLGTMGIGVLIQTVLLCYLIVLFFHKRTTMPEPYLWGVRLGLLIFLVGLLPGGAMIGLASHSVGVADGGRGLPFLNWSVEGGDLRIAHFAGMHALQILPLLAWWTGRNVGPRLAMGWIAAAATVYLTGVVIVFAQALASSPFIRW